MPKMPPEHADRRREQILRAAFACFADRGFQNASMEAICRAAKLSPGAVYHYFPSKEAILEALAKLGQDQTASLFAPDESGKLSAPLARALTSLGRPEATQVAQLDVRLWNEALHNGHLKELFLAAEGKMKASLAKAVAASSDKTYSDKDVEAVAKLLFAMLTGLELQKATHPEMDFSDCIAVLRYWFHETENRDQ